MPTRRRNKNTETELSRAIQAVLTAQGAWIIRVQAGVIPALYGDTKRFIHAAEPGCPDLLCMVPLDGASARFCWLEVKTKAGKLTKVQSDWHAKAAKRGIEVHVVRGIGEAVEAVFKRKARVA